LNVQIASTGGDPYFTINALEVIPTDDFQTATVTAPSPDSPLPANALDVDAFQIAEVQAGIYTVQVDLGTIVSADVAGSTGLADGDGSYAGFQVVVPSGQDRFHVNVRRPSTGGISTLTVQRIDGTESGSATQGYSLLPARRFDFNGSAGATQTGFTGVRGNQLYNAANGYGWTVAVPEFQRGETGYTVAPANVPLYLDGHWGSAARTFQVAVDPDKTYDVRVYVGDRSFARNLIQVTVEGAPTQHNSQPNSPRLLPSTTANGFVAVTIVGGKATDGVLDITIANTGGDPYWVINGIDVWQSDASDPGALNLLAGQWGSEMVGQSLTQEAIDAVLPLAREYWVSTGLADWQLPQLYQTPIAIGDLSYRGALGVSKPEGIWLDASGAGLGWHTSLLTPNSQLLTSSYDLLTVLAHELGHVLGYDDLDAHQSDHIMAGVLEAGGESHANLPISDRGWAWTAGHASIVGRRRTRLGASGQDDSDPRPADAGHFPADAGHSGRLRDRRPAARRSAGTPRRLAARRGRRLRAVACQRVERATRRDRRLLRPILISTHGSDGGTPEGQHRVLVNLTQQAEGSASGDLEVETPRGNSRGGLIGRSIAHSCKSLIPPAVAMGPSCRPLETRAPDKKHVHNALRLVLLSSMHALPAPFLISQNVSGI
jgi:hypothetical protein